MYDTHIIMLKVVVIFALLIVFALIVQKLSTNGPQAPSLSRSPSAPRPRNSAAVQNVDVVGKSVGATVIDFCFNTIKDRPRFGPANRDKGYTDRPGTCGQDRNSTYSWFFDKQKQDKTTAQLSTMNDTGNDCRPDLDAYAVCKQLFP